MGKDFNQNNDLDANFLSAGNGHGSATTGSSTDAQAGVKNIEAAAMTWTEWVVQGLVWGDGCNGLS